MNNPSLLRRLIDDVIEQGREVPEGIKAGDQFIVRDRYEAAYLREFHPELWTEEAADRSSNRSVPYFLFAPKEATERALLEYERSDFRRFANSIDSTIKISKNLAR